MVNRRSSLSLILIVTVAATWWLSGCAASPVNPASPAVTDLGASAIHQTQGLKTTRYAIYVVDGATGDYVAGAAITVLTSAGAVQTTSGGPHAKTTVDVPSIDTTVELIVQASGYAVYDRVVTLPDNHGQGLGIYVVL